MLLPDAVPQHWYESYQEGGEYAYAYDDDGGGGSGDALVKSAVAHAPSEGPKGNMTAIREKVEKNMNCTVEERLAHHTVDTRVAGGDGTHCFRKVIHLMKTHYNGTDVTRFGIDHLTIDDVILAASLENAPDNTRVGDDDGDDDDDDSTAAAAAAAAATTTQPDFMHNYHWEATTTTSTTSLPGDGMECWEFDVVDGNVTDCPLHRCRVATRRIMAIGVITYCAEAEEAQRAVLKRQKQSLASKHRGVSDHGDQAATNMKRKATLATAKADVAVDVLGTIGTPEAQEVLVDVVLASETPSVDLIKRVFVHCVDMYEPSSHLVDTVEKIAFNETVIGGVLSTADVVMHARLALGVLADAIGGQATRAKEAGDANAVLRFQITKQNIIDRLASQLEVHAPRQRREHGTNATAEEKEREMHLVVVMEALGNTAEHGVLKHLVPYANDKAATMRVRAGSVHALRSFRTVEVERILSHSYLYDPQEHVRKSAQEAFLTLPRSKTLAQVKGDAIAQDKWFAANNMSSAGRHRRLEVPGIPEEWIAEMDKWHVEVELPPFEWGLEVGVPMLEGAIGITLMNRATFDQDRLTSFFEVQIHDEAFATITIFGKGFDLFRARACFTGHIEFSLNVVKNGVEKAQKMLDSFDQLYEILTNDLTKGCEKLWDFVDKKLINGDPIGDLQTALNTLPEIFAKLTDVDGDDILSIITKIYDLMAITSPIPSITAAKSVVDRVLGLFNTAKKEVLDFYALMKQTIDVDFPWAWKTVQESMELTIEGLNTLFDSPGQAIQLVMQALTGLGAVAQKVMVLVNWAKKIFDPEQRPDWMKAETYTTLWKDFQDVFRLVKVDAEKLIKAGTAEAQQEADILKDFIDEVGYILMEDLDLFGPFMTNKEKVVDPIMEGFAMFETVMGMYRTVKAAFDKAKAIIAGDFGPSFHLDFAKGLRFCHRDCKCAPFPTKGQ